MSFFCSTFKHLSIKRTGFLSGTHRTRVSMFFRWKLFNLMEIIAEKKEWLDFAEYQLEGVRYYTPPQFTNWNNFNWSRALFSKHIELLLNCSWVRLRPSLWADCVMCQLIFDSGEKFWNENMLSAEQYTKGEKLCCWKMCESKLLSCRWAVDRDSAWTLPLFC